MSWSRHTRILPAPVVYLLTAALGFGQSGDVEFSVVAESGGTAPGAGDVFDGFHTPVIAFEGTIAFEAGVGVSQFNTDGIWIAPKGFGMSVFALKGTDSPWPFPNQDPPVYYDFADTTLRFLGPYGSVVADGPKGLAAGAIGSGPVEFLGPGTAPPIYGYSSNTPTYDADAARFLSQGSAITMYFQGLDESPPARSLYRLNGGGLAKLARGGDAAPGTSETFYAPNPFPAIAVSRGGDLVAHAIYSYPEPSAPLTSGTGIYYDVGEGLKLLALNGDPLPAAAGEGAIQLLFDSQWVPEAPSVSVARKVVFNALKEGTEQRYILQGSLETGEVTLVVKENYTVPIENGGEVTFENLMGRPVINESGAIFFRAVVGGQESLWRYRFGQFKRLVKGGDIAPGTDGKTFSEFPYWVVNAQGRVATLARLNFDPGVTTENVWGLWVQDYNGGWALVARWGSNLIIGENDYGVVKTIGFETNGVDGTGNDEGILSGLSDSGDVAFLATFASGDQAIVRATVNQGIGNEYFWNGATGSNEWYAKSGSLTNWKDENGANWSEPPGDYGSEKVTVDPAADVVLGSALAAVGKLTAKGSLHVSRELYLNGDSSIENLTLDHDSIVWTEGTLTLQGAQNVWMEGGFSQSDLVFGPGKLDVAASSTLTIPASETGTRWSDIVLVNNGTVALGGYLAFTNPAYLENRGQFNLSANGALDGQLGQVAGGTTTHKGGGASRIDEAVLTGGGLEIETGGTLRIDASLWKTAVTSVNIQKDGVLELGYQGSNYYHQFERAGQVIGGPGKLSAQNADIRVESNVSLSLRTGSVRIIDGFLGNKNYVISADARPLLTFGEPIPVGAQQVATLGSSGVTMSPLELRSANVINHAVMNLEKRLLAGNVSFTNTTAGLLSFRSAKMEGVSALGGYFELTNDGAIVLLGLNTLGTAGDDIIQRGLLQAFQNSETLIRHTSTLTAEGTVSDGTWLVNSFARLDANNNQQIKAIGSSAYVRLTGTGTFNNLPGQIPDFFSITGTLDLQLVANAYAAGAIGVATGGTLILNYSQLTAPGGVFVAEGGKLAGELNVIGNVQNSGRFSPGRSPGAATVSGNYEQTATGTLEIEIGGAVAGEGYDQLAVNGTLTLAEGSVIEVTLIDPSPDDGVEEIYIPRADDVFDFLSATNLVLPDGKTLNDVVNFTNLPQGVVLDFQTTTENGMTHVGLVVDSTLPPPPGPRITMHPAQTLATAGGGTTFTVAADSGTDFTYQWRFNGVDIAGATGASFTLPSVQTYDEGDYSVVVTADGVSTLSRIAELAVVEPAPSASARLVNLSTRALAGSGESTLILGFYIAGSGSKTLIIRCIGPELGLDPFNLPNVVSDPSLVIYSGQTVLDSNDDWNSSLASDFAAVGAFPLTPGSKDAAMKVTLPPGGYTVHLVNTGALAEGLIEVYDYSKDAGTRLANLSTRLLRNDGQTIIVGTYLEAGTKPLIVRADGPSLGDYGVDGFLPDPQLTVFSGTTAIGHADDWDPDLEPYFASSGAFPLIRNSKDAATRMVLKAGGYTMHASGNGSGVVLVELFESQ